MTNRFHQGIYNPVNPEKYLGSKLPMFRSSWEYKFMNFCDTNQNILGWASESHRIPYRHPFTGKLTTYVPDFFVIYADKNGKKHVEMIEIKPSKQTVERAKRPRDKAVATINEAKWKMAREWCKQQNIHFRIITEQEIFRSPKG